MWHLLPPLSVWHLISVGKVTGASWQPLGTGINSRSVHWVIYLVQDQDQAGL